ncbi:hypothetical protein DPMN_040692 [Dreissena polymorpha]|uniref:Uncharacterized protein n=1 Tax=Dreissena polymorpha TaxID=45954 RepID=A0A9D4CYS7_DREPO|nr:hypothetical protein DPMN_040692 [Dreissena polymorpha]
MCSKIIKLTWNRKQKVYDRAGTSNVIHPDTYSVAKVAFKELLIVRTRTFVYVTIICTCKVAEKQITYISAAL